MSDSCRAWPFPLFRSGDGADGLSHSPAVSGKPSYRKTGNTSPETSGRQSIIFRKAKHKFQFTA